MLQLLPKNPTPPFDTFYSEHYNRVLNYLKSKIDIAEDAEDVVSDIFLYCYQHYADYDPQKSSLTTWLYLIVNSRLKNYYRDHVTYTDFETVSNITPDDGLDLDQGVYLEQLHDFIMNSIKSLPERQQTIIILRYFKNCTSEEIAEKLGITPGNVRVLLSRALNKLSSANKAYWKEFRING